MLKEILKSVLTGQGMIKTVLDKVAPDKMSEAEKAAVELELQRHMDEAITRNEAQLRHFFLEYEGRAADVYWLVQIIRGLVRPVITLYVCGTFSYLLFFLFHNVGTLELAKMDVLMRAMSLGFWLTMICFSFWFGDRFLQKSGALEALKEVFRRRE